MSDTGDVKFASIAARATQYPANTNDVVWLVERINKTREAIQQMRELLREGREFALNNTRAAAVRHALFDWGERVERYLAVDFPAPPLTAAPQERTK